MYAKNAYLDGPNHRCTTEYIHILAPWSTCLLLHLCVPMMVLEDEHKNRRMMEAMGDNSQGSKLFKTNIPRSHNIRKMHVF